MNIKRAGTVNWGIVFLAAVTILCVIAAIGVFVFLIFFEIKSETLDFSSDQIIRSIWLLTWIVIGIDLVISALGWLLKFESQDALKESDDTAGGKWEKIEGGLEAADYLLELFMMLTFLFIGIRFFLCSKTGNGAQIWVAIALFAAIGAMWCSKKMLFKLSRRPSLNQKGNLHEEAVIRERMLAYRSGYRVFKMMNRILIGAMLDIMLLTRFSSFLATALFLEAGVIWAVMNGLFRLERSRLRKKGKRR